MRTMIAVALTVVIPLATPIASRGEGTPEAQFAGHYQCHSTTFFWPTVASEPPIQSATGTTELVSDGSGHFTSGSGVINVLDDIARPGSLVTCHFTLHDGTYSIDADGEGAAEIVWNLVSGSGTHCSNYVPGDLRPTGYIDETRDTNRPVASRTHFVFKGGRSYFSIVTPISSVLGVCDRAAD